jgi:hypothetical protein
LGVFTFVAHLHPLSRCLTLIKDKPVPARTFPLALLLPKILDAVLPLLL